MGSEKNLRQACIDGNPDQVREILESRNGLAQADLNKALGAATYSNHLEIAKQLLDHGAEITEFAVHGATYSLSVPILQHLLDRG
ncbi:hypothetical protein P170DRAFT_241041 [Aspergillus steynii IBT 23096]|uniref:Ankyrin n=1 Tax=Aspergillus steynii IBT 23096 TaxID=1392250 RepID=A0A2I2G3J0_9EURO|nr:uncharacterized protein P170DRAFT_241041 [Aspergillus steynii IBT 23096]PLB47445.1 hypothetical protein P170DRAFT_241041 [Aspergillus steynii IBT 23096]